MRTNITESDYGLSIEITPENTQEQALLLRYTLNAKAIKPMVSTSLAGQLTTHVFLKKISKKGQKTSISNYLGNKISNRGFIRRI